MSAEYPDNEYKLVKNEIYINYEPIKKVIEILLEQSKDILEPTLQIGAGEYYGSIETNVIIRGYQKMSDEEKIEWVKKNKKDEDTRRVWDLAQLKKLKELYE